MKKSLILLLILGSILIYLIYDSFQVKFESPKKNTLNNVKALKALAFSKLR